MIYKNNMGYCCICLSLDKEGVTTNRGMVKKTFLREGLKYVSELALKNTSDLIRIIKFNAENSIKMYRISSDMFPWMSEYEIDDLPNIKEILNNLEEAGRIAKQAGQRLSFHPSHFCVIASLNPDVVVKSVKELRQHAEIMDKMGLERSHKYPINIHINTTKPSKEESAERFIEEYNKLPDTVKSRLVLENDDKKSQFTPTDLYTLIYKRIGVPITYDYLHHKCNPDELSEKEALELCISTWPENIPALTHFSDSRKLFEDSSVKDVAHSDWIWSKIETYGKVFDIELEVKMKDLALLKYLDKWKNQI
jgi:UV DNA damage endonuclease